MEIVHPFLLAAAFMPAPAAGAQTCFHTDQIAAVPAAPTHQDDGQPRFAGNRSEMGAFITGATASVQGPNMTVGVAAQSDGGPQVPVPHTETIGIGALPASTCTITVAGSGVLDSAPPGQHAFNVAGGGATACDSIQLLHAGRDPFNDSTLLVHVLNPSSVLFDYPGFLLLDANGDTLGMETVELFGLGQESWHFLRVPPGTTLPQDPFTGTLELWTLFYQELGCSWNLGLGLCPPEPCAPLRPFIQNAGGALALGDFHYTIRRDGGPVATGDFTLTADAQYASDSICLPPGHYLMELVADQAPEGQVLFGVGLGPEVMGPFAPLVVTALSAVPFDFYADCINGPQGIAVPAMAALEVIPGAGHISVVRAGGGTLGRLRLFDARGRLLAEVNEPGSRHDLSTVGRAGGLYVLQALQADGSVLTARWAIP